MSILTHVDFDICPPDETKVSGWVVTSNDLLPTIGIDCGIDRILVLARNRQSDSWKLFGEKCGGYQPFGLLKRVYFVKLVPKRQPEPA
jgi:hypothetical protein